MKRINHLSSLILLMFVLIAACNRGEDQQEHTNETEAHQAAGHNPEVHLNKKQLEVMGITLGKPVRMSLSGTVKANGRLELPPQNKATVGTVIGGQVNEIHVFEGTRVQKGQLLATMQNPEYISMQEDYLQARLSVGLAEKNYNRSKKLFADSLTSEKAFQQAESDHMAAMAKLDAIKTRLEILQTDLTKLEQGIFQSVILLKAPIMGFVKEVSANIGKYVIPGEELFEIVDNEHIHIDLLVYEKDIGKIQLGQKVIFTLTNTVGQPFEGNVFAVGKAIDEETKAMIVHAEIKNDLGNLLPGMYVDARIITEEKNVIAIPNEALIRDGGMEYVFALVDNSDTGQQHDEISDQQHDEKAHHEEEMIFQKLEVSTGIKDIGFTEVVPVMSLNLKSTIVIKGAFYLQAELKKGEGGHGHHH